MAQGLVPQNKLIGSLDAEKTQADVHPNETIEAAAYTTMLNREPGVSFGEQYDKIKSNLELYGRSIDAENTLLSIMQRNNQQSMDALNRYIQSEESTPETIIQAADNVRHRATMGFDMATAAAEEAATLDLSETAEEKSAQDMNLEFFKDRVDGEKFMGGAAQFDPYHREDMASLPEFLLDFAAVMVPFNFQSGVREMKESLGLKSSMWDYVFFGSSMDDIKRHLNAMNPQRRVEAMQELHGLLQNQGFTGTNEYIGYIMTQELLDNPESSLNQEYIDNIIGVLDVLGVGQAAKDVAVAGTRGVKSLFKPATIPQKTPTAEAVQNALGVNQGILVETQSAVLPRVEAGNPLRLMVKVNPNSATEDIAMLVADESGELAAKMGTTRERAINEWVLPKAHIEASPITDRPAGVSERVLRIRQELADTVENLTTDARILFSEEELKGASTKALQRFGKLFNSKPSVADSTVDFTKDGISMTARFKSNGLSGWTSVRKLRHHIDTVFNRENLSGELNTLRVWKKNGKTGQWDDISTRMGLPANQKEGEYTFTIDFDMSIDPAMKQAFGLDSITAGLGRLTKYATNPHALFSRQHLDGAVIGKDRSAMGQWKFINELSNSFIKLRKASADDYNSVMAAIRKGGKEEVWYTSDQLKLDHGVSTQAGVDAYYSFKEIQDALFNIANKDAYKTLKREGFQSVYLDKKYSGFNVRKLDGTDTQIKQQLVGAKVYVPSTDRILHIQSQDHLQKLIDDGVQFGNMKSAYRIDDAEYTIAAIMPREGASVDLLTKYPVPYREGHYMRHYEDGNFVVKTTNNPRRTINGRKAPNTNVDEVLGIAKTREEAELIREQIVAEELAALEAKGLDPLKDGRTFDITTGELWHTGKSDTNNEWDILQRSMLNMNRRRGEWLRGLEDLATIDDPLEATAKQIGAVMDRTTKRDWVESSRASWMKTFGNEFNLKGIWPATVDDMRALTSTYISKNPQKSRTASRALQHYEYIEMVNGMPAKFDQWWRTFSLKMSEVTPTKVGTQFWQWSAKQKLEEQIKAGTFKVMLGMHPFKHLQLQPSQILQLALVEPKYLYSLGKGGFMREWMELANYTSSKAIGVDLGDSLPKGKELWEQFSQTGLKEAVAHHVFINPGDFTQRLKPDYLSPKPISGVKRTADRVVNAPSKYGFEIGELANVMMHWLVARQRWIRRNPGKSWKTSLARDEIHAEQRAISLNPNAAGKMGYQDWGTSWGGLSSILLQFFSHGHKTAMSVMPVKLGGSRVFTGKEKAKIAAANLTLFGTTVVPFLNVAMDEIATEAGWEVDPETWRLIKTGFVDVGLNRLLSVMSGEEQDIRWSATFNPTSGIEAAFENIYGNIMNDPDYRPHLFAAASIGSNIMQTAASISQVWKQPEEMPVEKIQDSFQQLAEIFPGYSDFTKARIIFNTGQATSRGGRRIGEATMMEGAFKLMGWQIGTEQDHWDHMERAAKVVYEGTEVQLRESAKEVLGAYLDIYKTEDQGVDETLLMMMGHLPLIYKDMRERRIVMDEMGKLTRKALKSGEENIITLAIKASHAGDREELINFIRNSEGLPEEGKNALLYALDGLEGNI